VVVRRERQGIADTDTKLDTINEQNGEFPTRELKLGLSRLVGCSKIKAL
jgi:hypothetical protein